MFLSLHCGSAMKPHINFRWTVSMYKIINASYQTIATNYKLLRLTVQKVTGFKAEVLDFLPPTCFYPRYSVKWLNSSWFAFVCLMKSWSHRCHTYHIHSYIVHILILVRCFLQRHMWTVSNCMRAVPLQTTMFKSTCLRHFWCIISELHTEAN